MTRFVRSFCLAAAGLSLSLGVVWAASPVKIAEVIPVEELSASVAETADDLQKLIASEAAFKEADSKVTNTASVLASLAQALSEVDGEAPLKPVASHIRKAAQDIAMAKDFAATQGASQKLAAALKGGADLGDAPAAVAWGKVAKMHPVMEVMEQRSTMLSRAIKRLRKPEEEAKLASSIAVLALVTHGDTHEVKDEADLPQWHALALELQTTMSQTATAIRAKDKAAAEKAFNLAKESCDKCHEKFQD